MQVKCNEMLDTKLPVKITAERPSAMFPVQVKGNKTTHTVLIVTENRKDPAWLQLSL